MTLLRPVALLLVAAAGLGGLGSPSTGQEKSKKEEPGPRLIDFAPLPTGRFPDYSFSLKCQAGQQKYAQIFNVKAGIEREMIRDWVMASLEAAKWKVKRVGSLKLIVEGYDRDPVRSPTLTDTLSKKNHPKVSRYKQP